METVNIIFADGTKFSAMRNGDCLIVKNKPTFPEDLSVITIQGTYEDTVYHNAELVECASVDGMFWFTFIEASASEMMIKKIQSDIRTIARVAECDIDADDSTPEIGLRERINDLEIAICEIMDALA